MLRRSSWLILIALTSSSCADESPPNVIDAGAATDAATPDAGSTVARRPNILLIIADDLGLDASSQYGVSADRPATPTLDALAAVGIVFENAWATPACTTTRGTIISGKHGIHSGVTFVPAVLPDSTRASRRS